jgi:hypothetical protein
MSKTQMITALNVRLWLTAGGVHPYNPPEYLAMGKISGDPAKSYGEATRIPALQAVFIHTIRQNIWQWARSAVIPPRAMVKRPAFLRQIRSNSDAMCQSDL